MKELFFALGLSTLLTIILGWISIPLLKKIKAGQPILEYVQEHKNKNGTPTMGGLFFILSAISSFAIFGGFKSSHATVAVCIGLAFMVVGFLDDFLKIKTKNNQGLKAYQKIIFQTVIAFLAGGYAYYNGNTIFYVPFINISIDLGLITLPFLALIFIAITNSVNLTDGLDGLASSISIVYLIFISALIFLQGEFYGFGYKHKTENFQLIKLSLCLVGSLLGFVLFNTNKASVFMGDCGSLSLGGFIGAISIFSRNSLFIPLIGATFVFSSISVIIQVLYYKKTKKRVFLMAPFHHHLQLKGYSECKITYAYSLITGILGALSLISYL